MATRVAGALAPAFLEMTLFDAHCHLQDGRLDQAREQTLAGYEDLGVDRVVVNGTREDDWESVAQLADRSRVVKPSFGLHPWFVNTASERWKDTLSTFWLRYPNAGVGEIGLDRWIEGYCIERQLDAFRWQLEFATSENRPVSIHCLRAWGMMYEELANHQLPERGVMLHSFGGPKEMVEGFAKLGAYFSVSGYFSIDRKEKQREALRAVPLDRLLVETDAPDMSGKDEYEVKSLEVGDGEKVNHPHNIEGVYRFVSDLREVPENELRERVGANFRRFFGD